MGKSDRNPPKTSLSWAEKEKSHVKERLSVLEPKTELQQSHGPGSWCQQSRKNLMYTAASLPNEPGERG